MLHPTPVLLAALAVAALAQALLVAAGATPAMFGEMVDADAYMRLERVRHLYEAGGWFDHHMTSTNAPFGESINWSRAFDALLLAGAWVGARFVAFEPALFAWGMAISPVLLAATVLALSWALRPLLGSGGLLLAVVIAMVQPQLAWIYLPGRPDHHSLMGLIFVVGLGFLVRLAMGTGGPRLAALAGAVGALALWVSVESLVAQSFFPLALIVLWIWRRDDFLAKIAAYLAGLAGGLAVVLLAERGLDPFAPSLYARVSVVHFLLAATSALVWAALRRVDVGRTAGRRLAAAAAAAVAIGLVMLAAFPKFFGGPLVEMDPAVLPWLHENPEFEKLWPDSPARASKAAGHLLPGLCAAAYAVWRLRRGDGPVERLLATLLVGLALFLPLALYQLRWSSYVQLLAVAPWTLALLTALTRIERLRSMPSRVIAHAGFLVGGATLHLLTAIAIAAPDPRPAERDPRSRQCADFQALGHHLAAERTSPRGAEILFTYLYRGPEMLWWSGHAVVGAPYINAASLLDTAAVFATRNPEQARRVLAERGVRLVATCTCCNDATTYTDPASFHEALRRGDAPAWLRPLPLPEALARQFHLWRLEP